MQTLVQRWALLTSPCEGFPPILCSAEDEASRALSDADVRACSQEPMPPPPLPGWPAEEEFFRRAWKQHLPHHEWWREGCTPQPHTESGTNAGWDSHLLGLQSLVLRAASPFSGPCLLGHQQLVGPPNRTDAPSHITAPFGNAPARSSLAHRGSGQVKGGATTLGSKANNQRPHL